MRFPSCRGPIASSESPFHARFDTEMKAGKPCGAMNCTYCPGRPRPWLSRWGCHCLDRKSTRLNSSHLGISYAVFCLKKKYKQTSTVGVDVSIEIILSEEQPGPDH